MGENLSRLGIDLWSMAFYVVNIGLTMAILIWILYKPVNKFIDQRQRQIEDSIDEAKKLQESFEEKLNLVQKDKEETEAQLKAELLNLQKFTDRKRAELTAEMEQARKEMIEKATREIDARKTSIIKEAEKDVQILMAKIILDIVENKVPENIIQESIESSWSKLNK
ncbi:hypothetical protein CVV38_03300 [Candidatus Peregrinibacteria bacterium HGW-Peregrinibacteria-1]|jgi:F0F1-type ATP synthase membrane subunit b/b'|nr:MAG: hypothetical protein CVV38_03300 [Candidatus Peregrinibacteria bacterium HGW-Peregrinibacteria-1]